MSKKTSTKMYLKNPIRLLLAFLLIMVLSMAFMLLFQGTADGSNIPEYTTIIVSKGETLWNIASKYCGDNENIRNKIDDIKALNNISSDIKTGQELTIRIK